jgi:polysaccharide deacetylase 2 family uncharacterized protein YibQ
VASDDLNAPLGQDTTGKPRFRLPIAPLTAIAGALGGVVFIFLLWVAFADDPMGGEPMAVVSTASQPPAATAKAPEPAGPPPGAAVAVPNPSDGKPTSAQATAKPPGQTITIIDGSSGKSQEVVLPGPAGQKRGAAIDERLLEKSRHGAIPRIAADGARPSDAYAQPVKPAPGASADGPRIALIVGGLGIGASGTSEALTKLPEQVTLAFAPYASDLASLAGRARGRGHEVLLQLPMEPFDYPDNDPGPQTLLTSIASDQNVDRLHWLLSRAQGYVGVTNFMGARFTASEQALAPILREIAKRGLLYVDDGGSPRSLAGQMAGANNLPFAKAEVVLDAVPIPAEIDRALGRLEALARERGFAVGMATGQPATIDRLAKWAKAAAGRGIVLVPISAVAAKPKSS